MKGKRCIYRVLYDGIGNAINCLPVLDFLFQYYDGINIVCCEKQKIIFSINYPNIQFGESYSGLDVYESLGGDISHFIDRSKKDAFQMHEVQANFSLLRPKFEVSGDPVNNPIRLSLDIDYHKLDHLIFGLAPGKPKNRMWRNKFWRLECWSELASQLKKIGEVVTVGHTSDNYIPGTIDWRRKDLVSILDTLFRTSLLITVDCGLAHLSSAIGLVPIVLWGPTSIRKNAPWNGAVILFKDLPCQPCQYTPRWACKENMCMNINPRSVFKLIRSLILKTAENNCRFSFNSCWSLGKHQLIKICE